MATVEPSRVPCVSTALASAFSKLCKNLQEVKTTRSTIAVLKIHCLDLMLRKNVGLHFFDIQERLTTLRPGLFLSGILTAFSQ